MTTRGWFLVAAALLWVSATALAAAPAQDAGPTRTVEVEGAAAITGGNVPAARRAAITAALREAVEQTVGVYVTSTTQTRNFTLLEDRIYTRSAGFAVLDRVLDEREENGTYHVRIRATVSVKPLLEQLKAAGLTRQWRVIVALQAGSAGYDDSARPDYDRPSRPGYYDRRSSYYDPPRSLRPTRVEDKTSEAELQRRLLDAGFYVVDWRQQRRIGEQDDILGLVDASPAEIARVGRRCGADILILGQVSTRVTANVPVPLPVDIIHLSYARCKAQATVRAIRADTGEVIDVQSISEDGEGTSRQRAADTALSRVGRRLGDRFTDALLLLPAGISRTVQVVVAGFDRVSDARRFEDALGKVPGVNRVTRQDYAGGTLILDVEADQDAADRLSVSLEESPELQEFQLHVESDSKGRITARTRA